MNVNIAPSFFESLKRIGSFKDKWLTFKGWIKYHLFNNLKKYTRLILGMKVFFMILKKRKFKK